jgi:Lysylphosphatidylglycerol synthase TM region
MEQYEAGESEPLLTPAPAANAASVWKRSIPYIGTLLIFALIFWRIPIRAVAAALEQAPVLQFFAVFLPFSVFYWMIDSACLTWVIRRFNAPLRFRDIVPIRASMYLLALINTNVAQGGVAWYLHRKAKVPFVDMLSSILLIALVEVYQLFFFSTLGVMFHQPGSRRQLEIVRALRVAYVFAWLVLAAIMILFARARRSDRVRTWIAGGRLGGIAGTFLAAGPLDYAVVLAIKAPGFLGSVLAHHFALSLYGIAIPLGRLIIFLPLVFLAAALPIAVAHLGTSQAAWLLFFSGSAPDVKILAYSLAAHFTFMCCNGLIGLFFLPRASRELTAIEVPGR